MNKTIKELERERKEKISDLNLDETKAYIKSLNLKRFEAMNDENNKEKCEFYDDKLKEVFELSTFINLDVYSLANRLDLTNCLLLETKLKCEMTRVLYTASLLNNGYYDLMNDLKILKTVLKIYYHNHKDKHHNMHLEIVISNLLQNMLFLINSLEYHEEVYDENAIDNQLKEAESEKQFVLEKADSSEGISILKGGNYLQFLKVYSDLLHSFKDILRDYSKIKSEVMNFISLDDVFSEAKKEEFDFYIKECGESPSNRDEFFNSRPSYNLLELKFIPSDD